MVSSVGIMQCPSFRNAKVSMRSHQTSRRPSLLQLRCDASQQKSDASISFSRRDALIAAVVATTSQSLLDHHTRAWADEVPISTESTSQPANSAAPGISSYSSKVGELYDPILAYRFNYPTETVSGKGLRLVLSHEPEKYSSAAPLTADARQRIVSELFDFQNFVTVSMTVGPAAGILKERAPAEWRAKEVANTVLIDRSTARVTNGQRIALNDVADAHIEDKDWGRVYVFEHSSQGSPTPSERTKETYRHSLAVTGTRTGGDGVIYLYTLNFSCREEAWLDLEPIFRQCVGSFKLEKPTDAFISPDTNPWLFF